MSDRSATRKVMRATRARKAVVSFWPLFADGGLIACLAPAGARSDLFDQHTRSLPATSLIDGQAVCGIPVDCRAARDWSKFQWQ